MSDVSLHSCGLRHNGVTVYVQSLPSHKRPVLMVQIENCGYKVASFNNVKTANWFVEVMQEFFEGLVKQEEEI